MHVVDGYRAYSNRARAYSSSGRAELEPRSKLGSHLRFARAQLELGPRKPGSLKLGSFTSLLEVEADATLARVAHAYGAMGERESERMLGWQTRLRPGGLGLLAAREGKGEKWRAG